MVLLNVGQLTRVLMLTSNPPISQSASGRRGSLYKKSHGLVMVNNSVLQAHCELCGQTGCLKTTEASDTSNWNWFDGCMWCMWCIMLSLVLNVTDDFTLFDFALFVEIASDNLQISTVDQSFVLHATSFMIFQANITHLNRRCKIWDDLRWKGFSRRVATSTTLTRLPQNTW